jgi:hypothetical protein
MNFKDRLSQMSDDDRVALLTANSESIFYVRELRQHIADVWQAGIDYIWQTKSASEIAQRRMQATTITTADIANELNKWKLTNYQPSGCPDAADCPCQAWPVASIRDPFLTSDDDRHHADCDGMGARTEHAMSKV